ncbi:MAG: FdhF/YdeP family oxidoreductase [Planctomycetota bacterium]|nr:FdhF/YdeP family oxidoreductase [Planctomycetota bacterium]
MKWIPFGLGVKGKPRHFRDMFAALWENKGQLPFAWRILKHGVCDGCSLGPYGLRDNVMDGIHLCTTRLRLLKLNTMGPLDLAVFDDPGRLEGKREEELRSLGRIPFPMVREAGDKGFRRISWDDALSRIESRLRETTGERTAWFATSRGLMNETYYVFQKVARVLGSPHVDYAARLCHAPSVFGLQDVFGVGAPNCSLKDFIGTDLMVLWGTNLANNQPVTMKYLHYAKQQGTRVVLINPYREPGLERYWVPSIPSSAVFGTQILDDFFQVSIGGDIAFMNGILKVLLETGGLADDYLKSHATGLDELREKLGAMSFDSLERGSGLPRSEMERFAKLYSQAKTAVFVYSMGLTQHRFGVQNVRSIATLALARGMIGREKCGVMPIRGHSGVQGGSECGVGPAKFPGGDPINPETAKKWEKIWGAPVPSVEGLPTPLQIEAAHDGKIDFLYNIGGNLFETLPDPDFVREALGRIKTRVHQDIVLNNSMFLPGPEVLILPAATRYETPGGGTSTSTERRLRFSPEIPGRRIGEAKPEWEIPVLIAKAVHPRGKTIFPYESPQDIRDEMDRTIPIYKGIAELKAEGDQFQWGGERLFEGGAFAKMPGGKARLWVQDLPDQKIPEGSFALTTRRGKQFNSMTYGNKDPLHGGAARDSVFMNSEDADRLSLREGDRVRLESETGHLSCRVLIGPVRARTLQVYWPEANVLLSRRLDPISGEPDYNAMVTVQRAGD